MWGFLYRSTLGSLFGFVRGKRSFGRLLQSWKAALALPLVYLGWVKDFWLLFDWYLQVEKGLSPTYFFIPFKGRRGEKVVARHPGRRATAYDIGDIPELASQLMREGCELGVHGLDAWHDVQKAREERQRLAAVTGPVEVGIRTHWLLQDADTYRVLDEAGYDYDSTAGYNETPGYRCGTGQVFRPLTASNLLELPLHIQDGALFYSKRLDLSESEALELCHGFIQNAQRFGGVLTLLWHDRSPGPERFWGEFYARLVSELKTFGPWFATGSQVVAWFRQRRAVAFERLESAEGIIGTKLRGNGRRISPPLKIRIHSPLQAGLDQPAFTELAWEGDTEIEFGSERATPNYPAMGVLAISTCE
jgi:peptidoglycan/xylan/chitin deacetylase (PgdA/CDA1 family)